ncbi:hypothetical protein BH10ACT7_BH10ACT7_04110 [soil metagenome]
MNPRVGTATVAMSPSEVNGRAQQARDFLETAQLALEIGPNSAASNAVLAGIAAGDAICGKALGIRSHSGSHGDAVAIVRRAHGGESAANHLKALVALKSAAAYEPRMVTAAKASEAVQHAERLVVAMEKLLKT